MTPQQQYNALLAQKVIGEFQKRKMDGFYCETAEAALQKALELTPKGSTVSHGGSETLHQMGLRDALKGGDYHFLDPIEPEGAAKKDEIAHLAVNADTYFMSSNAITMSGELVNIDGYGNRVASLIFGPKQVIVIAGMNKVVPNVDAAIERIRKVAGPLVMLKWKNDYPSYDEMLTEIEYSFSQLVITNSSMLKGRIKVILVGESLGY